jgi:hypothetical protein
MVRRILIVTNDYVRLSEIQKSTPECRVGNKSPNKSCWSSLAYNYFSTLVIYTYIHEQCVRKRIYQKQKNKTKKPLNSYIVGFQVFTAVVMKSIIFWDITRCSPLSLNRRFGGTYRLHLQRRRNKFIKNQQASKQVASRFCWTYFFDPEDGGDMFLRNVGWNSTDYTASYPRSWYSSIVLLLTDILESLINFTPSSIIH